ncbi:MAG: glycosyltransferase family 2 protein [Lachnospiraceae bacterium]
MSGAKKVSVCLPTYNHEEEAARALESLGAQDFRDAELIVSDDSEEDGVEKRVRAFSAKNPDIPVTYVRNHPKKGHIFNWNAALDLASGTYVKILFSDDFFTDEHALGAYVDLLEQNPQADLAFSGSRQVRLEEAGTLAHLEEDAPKERAASDAFLQNLQADWRYLFLGNEIGAPSAVIFRRSTGARFDEKSGWASDMYLYADLLKNNPRFVCTKAPLISIGMHPGQYTESFAEKDERIYADYRYFYLKYDLSASPACRAYFLSRFLVKYKKPWQEAKDLGYTRGEYLKALAGEGQSTLRSFLGARMRFLSK